MEWENLKANESNYMFIFFFPSENIWYILYVDDGVKEGTYHRVIFFDEMNLKREMSPIFVNHL